MKISIFDSHAHYDDEAFDEDREKVIEEIHKNGVVGVLNCGASLKGAEDSVKLADKYDFIYAAVGVHPTYADSIDEDSIKKLRDMASNPKVRAIGEIGLDYYWDENPPRDIQKRAFREQMKLARELKLPVIIHDRDAHADTLEILKEFPDVIGVIHCFSGSAEFAKECLDLGYYIGFTGVITFKNARKAIEAAKVVPLDRLLVETDCPYMAPVPYRGKRNQSTYIEQILVKISEVKDVSLYEITENTISNIKNLLKIQ